MDQIRFTHFILQLSLSAAFEKYTYIPLLMSWDSAQHYCRLFHTDLAPAYDRQDSDRLQQLVGGSDNPYMWIGMERSSTNGSKWMWSDGGEVSTFFWAPSQPDNRPSEDYGVIGLNGWHDAAPSHRLPFSCYSALVVRQRKTWEKALEYCRERHSDLASVESEAEMMLIHRELDRLNGTDRVWIGLHFFPGGWLWVDSRPLDYEAWGPGNKHACPQIHPACAAVRATERTGATTHAGAVGVWEANDCEERLPFICN